MKIIPVIDLKDGQVVSAQQGRRETYQAIKSTLSSSSAVEDIINGFLSVYPFTTLYIADLNAITNTGSNQQLIDKVINENQNIEFWIDNGKKIQQASEILDADYKLIIGSEYQNLATFNCANNTLNHHILSLDFFPEQGYKGPIELLKNPKLWPQEIIVMTLDRVGNNTGPDIERLRSYTQKHPEKNFIAAGGIRNANDLLNLKQIGINHALIASALHSGTINTKVIKNLQAKKYPG